MAKTNSITRSKLKKNTLAFGVLLIALFLCVLFAVSLGSVTVPVKEVWSTILGNNTDSEFYGVIHDIRLPRVIMALFVGANLAVAGVLLQSVMQNPLADPGVTGISTGASVTVVFLLLYVPKAHHMIPIIGFLGSALACILVYSLAWKNGITAMRIILAGVAVNSILGGITGMMNILNSDKLAGVLSWMNGSLSGKSWDKVWLCMLYSVIGIALAMFLSKSCNLLSLGDKTAKSLGVNPNLQRLIISAVAVFLAGISTSFVGIISFVGLMVPHVARMIIGSDHRYLLPFSALLGSTVLILADLIGRTIASPYEIPVGIVMSVMGGPFFLYLLRKGNKGYGS